MVASGTPCESSSTVSRSGHLVASMRRRRSASSASSKPTSNARMAGVACVADICSSYYVVDVVRAGAKKSTSSSLTRSASS